MTYKIKEIREAKHMTQEELAKKSGISRVTISAMENGADRNATSKTLFSLVFGLVFLTVMHNKRQDWYELMLWPAVVCGIFWPIGAPIYAAYILAKLYADSKE